MEPTGKKRTKGSKGGRSKRKRKLSQSDEESPPAFLSSKYAEPPASKIYNSRIRKHAPAELFRKDLISAMKLPDSEPLTPDDYWLIEDPWRPEWEKGVQVPVEPDALPEPTFIEIRKRRNSHFKLPKKLVHMAKDERFSPNTHSLTFTSAISEQTCRYDLDDVDCQWLQSVNEERDDFGLEPIEELTVEKIIEEIEDLCSDNLQEAIRNDATFNMEADEDAICDVCRSPDSEDGNEIVFCDACNICVHQSCYGITKIPEGSWICRTCALGLQPVCILCPNRGGAMKPTSGERWCHVSCAIWLPEVSIGCVEKMEPITKISNIPPFRWLLICSICEEKIGACIQCSAKTCKVSYHVTCAFKARLKMRAIMSNDDDDALKLKSYCDKHAHECYLLSDGESDESNKREIEMTSEEKRTMREGMLREREANFFNYATLDEVLSICSCDRDIVELVYDFWKLKRRANFNRPLLRPRDVNVAGNSMEENCTYSLVKRMVLLRRDLERSRNLCYMVTKREKMVKSWIKAKEDIFVKQAEILSSTSVKLSREEHNAVLTANYGDLAHDKKHTGPNGPAQNTLEVLNALIGEENTRTQLNGILKMSKKNESSQLKKPVNPYAKHYLNGILKRSQRYISSVGRYWEDCYSFSEQSMDEKRESHASFTGTSDHMTSDDGLDTANEGETSMCPQSSSSIHQEDTVQAESCNNKTAFSKNFSFQNCCKDDSGEQVVAVTVNDETVQIDVPFCDSNVGTECIDSNICFPPAVKPVEDDKCDTSKKSPNKMKRRKFLNTKVKKNLNEICNRRHPRKSFRNKKFLKNGAKIPKEICVNGDCSGQPEDNKESSCDQIIPQFEKDISFVSESQLLLDHDLETVGNNVEISFEVQQSISSASEDTQCTEIDLPSVDMFKVIDESAPLTVVEKDLAEEVKENSFGRLVGLEEFVHSECTDGESQDSESPVGKCEENHDVWLEETVTYDHLQNTEEVLSNQEMCSSLTLTSQCTVPESEKPLKSKESLDSDSSKSNCSSQRKDSTRISTHNSLSLVNKHKSSPISENDETVNKLELLTEKSLKGKECLSSKTEVSNKALPRKGSLTGYKIPKKVRSNVVVESTLERNRGNSPLSPLTDRTPSSTSTSSSYASTNSYQTRRNNSPVTQFSRDSSKKLVNHTNHHHPQNHQHPPPAVRSHTESHRLVNNNARNTSPAVESYQWRAMCSGKPVEVPDGHWRPLQYQRLPIRSFAPHYHNPNFRQWAPVRGPHPRRPPHPFGPRPNLHA